MKDREFTSGITFFVPLPVYHQIKNFSHLKQMSCSELIREAIDFYFSHQNDLMEQTKSNGQPSD